MSTTMPYVKWHGRDWLGDPMLRMVGPEVRGVWIDLLCAMMNADPYGHLAVNGSPMTDEQAARLTGVDIGTFKGILAQIESANISSRTDTGILYSRRLVRDYAGFMQASNNGRKGGGNPALKHKEQEKKPETRSQKPEAKGTIKDTFIDPFIGFDAFWSTWPKHPRKVDKPKCLKTWKRDGLESRKDEVITALEAWKRSDAWTKDGGQFIPAVTTWLNQRRYDDLEAAAAKIKPSTGTNANGVHVHVAPEDDPEVQRRARYFAGGN
jgi:hypothetical protein